jgi:RNA polymerase sigma factor (sigma-70 family)
MASVCIAEVRSIPDFPLQFTVKAATEPEQSPLEPLPTATVVALITDEQCTAILKTWDRDIRRAAHAAAHQFQLDYSYADDFAQEARIRLARVLRRSVVVPPQEYLRRIISNAIQSAVSATRSWSGIRSIDELTEEFEAKSGASAGTDPLKIAAVAEFVRSLPANLQQVYQLIYEQGHTQREVASQLGVAQPRVAQMNRELLSRGQYEMGHLRDGAELGTP